jgi:hypothetical protein
MDFFANLFRLFRAIDQGDETMRRSRDKTIIEMAQGVLFFGAGAALIIWMLFYWL